MLLDCAELAYVNNVTNNINDEISFLANPLHQKFHSITAFLDRDWDGNDHSHSMEFSLKLP